MTVTIFSATVNREPLNRERLPIINHKSTQPPDLHQFPSFQCSSIPNIPHRYGMLLNHSLFSQGAYHFRRYFSVTALDPCAMLSIMTNDETPKHEGMTKYPNTQARRKTEVRMTNNLPESGDQARKKPYDLEERTALFGESVIDYLKKVPVTPVTRRLIDQLVGAGTSMTLQVMSPPRPAL